MINKWISPKIIIGPVATGDYYYHRLEIVEDIWEELEKGNFVLIAAPRRVGKTSVMKFMVENPKENYKLIFENIQGINAEDDFYKMIYKLILGCLSDSKKIKNWFLKYLKSKSISEVDITGSFKISDQKIDYLEEINKIIPQLDADCETIILLIDELPEVLHNLYKSNKNEQAISILKNLRRWRQDTRFKKLQFVLAGSIGIHYVVNTIEGRNSDLNDLRKVYCNPLSGSQPNEYIDWATREATIKYNDELKEYFLNKIQYFVPYFINIVLSEIDKTAKRNKNSEISTQSIDDAFEMVIINNDHFKDWKKRLSDYLTNENFLFVNEILIHIAHEEYITIQTIYDKAIKHNKTSDYMDFIGDLEQDGYIIENDKKYIFISPFLKEFWKRNNPIYNG
jgi:AAA+ ATPase superfamily predicted ATPase